MIKGGIYQIESRELIYYIVVDVTDSYTYVYRVEWSGNTCSNSELNHYLNGNRILGFCNLDDFRCVNNNFTNIIDYGYLGTITDSNFQYLKECLKEWMRKDLRDFM